MAEVPARYIKNKDVFWDAELFALFGIPFSFSSGLEIESPSIAVWSMLEILDSKFIKDPANATLIEIWRCVYICKHKKNSMPLLKKWVDQGKLEFTENDFSEFDYKCINFCSEYLPEINSEIVDFKEFLNLSFTGYEMIPSSGGGSEWIFGAPSIGTTLFTCSQHLNIRYDELLWDVPLLLLGHISQSAASFNGAKSVCRPKDVDDIQLQFKLANEREKNGELHPWQIDDPKWYPPTQIQKEANENLLDEFNDLLKKQYELKNKYSEYADEYKKDK